MNILICTITRNDGYKLNNYYKQVVEIVKKFPEHNFYLSLYENDSIDNTREIINKLNFSIFKDYKVVCENLSFPFFNSISNDLRMEVLADCRNQCLFECNFLDKCNYVLMIESDVYYNTLAIEKLFNFLSKYNPDIVSSVSFIDPYKYHHYDWFGTRKTNQCFRSNIPFDWKNKEYDEYYATFNLICLYKSEAFKKGACFSGFNNILNIYDCDTVVVCQKFRELGFDKIFMCYESRCFQNI